MLKPLLTPAEAARHLGVHINSLRRYVHNGDLAAVRVGKHLRFDQDVLAEWLAKNSTVPAMTPREPFWLAKGSVVVLQARLMPLRWQNIHYEFLLRELITNPDKQVGFLQMKTWWIPAMEAELREIATKAGR